DSMPLIVWAADEKGEVDFFCQPLVDYTGVPMEVLSEPGYWVKHIHPDDVEETLKTWEHNIRTGDPYSMEFRIRRHDGVYRWFLNQANPIRNSDGKIIRWYGTSTDIQHQKDMEEEARELARRMTTTLESITDAFLTLDREWRFTYINRQAEKVLQRNRDEILGKVCWDEFPAAKGSEFEKQYIKALETGEPSRFEAYYPAPLNTWFALVAYPSEDGLSIYFNDISSRRKGEEELRLLQTCIERLNDIVLIADSTRFETEGSRIVFVNKAFERKTGYTREEVIGKSPGMLQGPETNQGTIEEIRAAIRKKKNIRRELRNYTKDGTPYWAEVDLVPIFDEKGNHHFIVAIERDITARKQAEGELFRSRQKLELILTSVGEGIHGLDTDGNILFENPAAARMFGWDIDSVVGRHSHSLIHHHRVDGTDYPVEECPIYQALRDGKPRRVNDEVFFRKDGTPFPVEYYACPMCDTEGNISGVVVTFRDVTEQRSLEEQLRQSQRLEAVGQLTGGMAHDFNNLLTVVQGNSDLLLEMIEADSPLYPLVDMISSASQRGADLTHRLLAFSRRQALDPKPVDVNRLTQDLEPLLRRALGEQVEIELVCGAGLWRALVDPVQLESALLNLTLNARDAMAQGGRLTIETANYWINEEYANSHSEVLPGQYVQIAVSDTGSGILPEDLGKVFEPFYTTKESGKGTGLGLSMVYGFVKQSRGHIKIYSEPGDGTTVKIYLPRLMDNGEHQVRHASVSSVDSGNEVILLVEDDELVRHYAETCLASLGYRVITAENGKQALDIIQEMDEINLLFTDIVMPGGMNGRQLADRAVEIRPNLKVLYTSGYTDNAIVHHGRLDPGAQLLGKPYGRADLARKIREVLEQERP
ncbi:MAG: PAS domain S-box protein, partial [Candidatus Sumerlaeia bacterium]|nr:PAS domain S-box protein [Candidatus Sumerlaeia bacterium]